jgi:hypothetical protein
MLVQHCILGNTDCSRSTVSAGSRVVKQNARITEFVSRVLDCNSLYVNTARELQTGYRVAQRHGHTKKPRVY